MILSNPINFCPAEKEFTIEQILCPDTDSDGVIDTDEDVNDNNDLEDDDTDGDGIANYKDSDDDGDLVPTAVEVAISSNSRKKHSIIDTDGDQTENYLDEDDDGDGVLTMDEDYNNNGDPTDDDTDNSGVPDYLEANVFLEIDSQIFSGFQISPNPAEGVIAISNLENSSRIEIFDLQGKQVILRTIPNNQKEIHLNLENLKRGLYIVVIQSGYSSFRKKLIVN